MSSQPTLPLFIVINGDGSTKMGTCEHCVVHEQGRPARAWDPDGDKELDFDRDGIIAALRNFGIQVEITTEYVCP